jgi:phytoene desaturase
LRAIVIGSGVAGLASAIRLRCKGYRVSLFEAGPKPGGKLNEFWRNGFRFDKGPSLFTLPEQVDELFRLAGIDPEPYFQYHRLDTVTRYFFDDGLTFDAPDSQEGFIEQAAELFHEPGDNIRRFFDKSRRIYELTHKVFLERSLHKLSHQLRGDTLYALTRAYELNALSTMAAANQKFFRHPHLRQFFNRYATYNGSNPYVAPATLNVIPHLEHARGAYLPQRGMYQIVEALTSLCRELEVDLRLETPVRRIVNGHGRVRGVVTTDGEAHAADVVVSNADVTATYQRLLENERPPFGHRLQGPSTSALIFYWGMNGHFPQLDLHNILFSGDYESEFRGLFEEKSLGDDPTVYINITSKQCREDAPEGCENWYVMVNAPADHGQDWPGQIAHCRQAVQRKIERLTGIDVRAHILSEDVWSPPAIARDTSSYRGALYGTNSNNPVSAFLRHPNFSRRHRGLFFAGGSVHPGGGIPLCLLSARITGDLVPDPR